jgi:uncharacterized protein (DUF488 family)
MIDCLRVAGVKWLIDIRHSPCASNPRSSGIYGERVWHLHAGDAGIEAALRQAGIDYRWYVELGNPQKNDSEMRILRDHLKSGDARWPVNRGLNLLRELLAATNSPVALMCACADHRRCHRSVIAAAAVQRFPELGIEVRHLP